MHYIKILVLVLLTISCRSKQINTQSDNPNTLSKAEMLKDYNLFKLIFTTANAGLYKYHTKREIDRVFNSNEKLITEKLTHREFYNIIWNVIDYTGSCHNGLFFPDTLDKQLSKEKIYFPIPLKYINGKLYTNLNYQGIPNGSQILSINKIPEEQFSSLVSRYVSTDGFNKTGKYANIETDWLPFYIYLALGKQNEFKIKYKVTESNRKYKTTVTSVTYNNFYENFNKRHSKVYKDRKSEDYCYTYIDSIQTGLLEVTTFAIGSVESEAFKAYSNFLDSVFIQLKTENIPNLIVDIRGNGGGIDPNDLLLYSYLTNRKFKENITAYTTFQDIPYKEYYLDDDIDELPKELKEEHSVLKNGKYYQNDSFNKVWSPNINAYKGNIILLIDPYVASAGSLFASLVKSDKNAIVIGEETLGGYYGHTGHIPVTYELPNSKFSLSFSIVDIEQDVIPLADETIGKGIIPDFRVVQTYKDFLFHKDTQLHHAIQKIKTFGIQKS